MTFFFKFYQVLHAQAEMLNRRNILNGVSIAVRRNFTSGSVLRLVDLGCDDGLWTLELARAANEATSVEVNLEGVEIFEERAAIARENGLLVHIQDLMSGLPQPSESVGLVHANQVIEHLPDVDAFLEEIYRILIPGGTAIISSENASAWHNIVASIMGWQIFSLTNVSKRAGSIGNPLALHRGKSGFASSWTHKTIFNFQGFKEIFEIHGFEQVQVLGAGYHPLPAIVGKWDSRHAHFLTVIASKPHSSIQATLNSAKQGSLISAYTPSSPSR